jgi:hypothetical protein
LGAVGWKIDATNDNSIALLTITDNSGNGTNSVNGIFGIYALGSVSGSLVLDTTKGFDQSMTLTGDVTITAISASLIRVGQRLRLWVIENSTGGYGVTWPASVHGAMALNTAAGKTNVQEFEYDGTNFSAVNAGVSY